MRRPILVSFIALGAVIFGLGGTGLFAALSDTATTGTNSVTSKGLSKAAHVQLATAQFNSASGSIACNAFADDLASGLVSVTDVEAGAGGAFQYFCIKNIGSKAVRVTASLLDLVDTDIDCTGDEGPLGDTTCGGNQLGELSSALWLDYFNVDCATTSGNNVIYGNPPPTMAASVGPVTLTDIPAGATKCFSASVQMPAPPHRSEDVIQKAQSDQVTWRYLFTGQAL